MSEMKYDYWTMPLRTGTGVAWIDRRDVVGIVRPLGATVGQGNLEVHMKSGTIFTVVKWNQEILDDLLLKFSPYTQKNGG